MLALLPYHKIWYNKALNSKILTIVIKYEVGMARKDDYNASNITVLEGLEAVRKRPGMYIGSVSSKGLNHLIYEIVDNSVDEHLAGYCDRIYVTLEEDGSATI